MTDCPFLVEDVIKKLLILPADLLEEVRCQVSANDVELDQLLADFCQIKKSRSIVFLINRIAIGRLLTSQRKRIKPLVLFCNED